MKVYYDKPKGKRIKKGSVKWKVDELECLVV